MTNAPHIFGAALRRRKGLPHFSGKTPHSAFRIPHFSGGFTLIELLTVIAIIGILAAIAVPVVNAFKPNTMGAATRQLLDDLAHARQLALSQRTTVYMVFVPTNFWNDPAYGALAGLTPPAGTPSEVSKANKLVDKQTLAYAFVTLRSMGDQPGRNYPRYLSPWKSLPDGAFIPLQKFWPEPVNVPAMQVYTNNTALAYTIYPFHITNNIPFPSDSIINYSLTPPVTYVSMPYIAFNYLGQLVSQQDEFIPVAQGTVGFARNADKSPKLPPTSTPTFTENPTGNSTNAYNIVKIEWLTGRAHLERKD